MNNIESSELKLGILSGNPFFTVPLHVGRPNIGDKTAFLLRTDEMLTNKWLSNNGPFVREFEDKLASYMQVKHCIVTCNATIALEIVIRALGLSGEVIVPSFTFIATAHALKWQEITPVFCDIDPVTHCIDPMKIEKHITDKTSGVLGVHTWGRACEIDKLSDIANRNNLKLLFDAAHAFGCSYKGKMIGGFGSAEVFSFHATKFFNTFEGGAITTNDDETAEKIRLMKNFGFSGYDNVIYIGTNGKMTEISAAMGLTNLESVEDFIINNFENYKLYKNGLADIPGIKIIDYKNYDKSNYQYIVLEIDENVCGLSRDEIVRILHADNILARKYFYPGCHNMEPYRSINPSGKIILPVTEWLCQQVMLLPTGSSVTPKDIDDICNIIKTAVNNAELLRDFLSTEK